MLLESESIMAAGTKLVGLQAILSSTYITAERFTVEGNALFISAGNRKNGGSHGN